MGEANVKTPLLALWNYLRFFLVFLPQKAQDLS